MQDIEKIKTENHGISWIRQVHEMTQRKVTELLTHVSTITGKTYDLSFAESIEKEKPSRHRPPVDENLPKIDWF